VIKLARPKKKTVDYFPHIIKTGKTITILENKFGNDGYAFWFKLLEILGSTDGHYYEYINITDREFLHARTLVSEKTAKDILDLLAELDAIDKKLWKHNIIWSDNFIDNIEDAYARRKVNVPQKPSLSEINVCNNSSEEGNCNHNDSENSQSKVNKIKKNKNKEKPSNKFDTQTDKFSITKKQNGRYNYPDEYETIYSIYPKNKGTKKAGWRKWAARRREGVKQELLILAAKNYANECKKEKKDEKYVKYISTFFGPDEWWKKYLKYEEDKYCEKENTESIFQKQLERVEKYG